MSENGTSEVVEEAPKVASKVDEVDLYKCKYMLERRTTAALQMQIVSEQFNRTAFNAGVVEEDIMRYDREFREKYGVSLFKVDFSEDGTITSKPQVAGAPLVGVKS